MGASYTTKDGFTLQVHHTLYVDYGFSITRNGKQLFYHPCCLSNDSYGHKPNPDKFDDYEEAEAAHLDGDDNAFVPWTDGDWVKHFKYDADNLLEAYLPEEVLNAG